MWETQVQSLGQKDPLEKEMATHSSIFAWRIPQTEEPGELQSMGSQRGVHDWTSHTHTHVHIHTHTQYDYKCRVCIDYTMNGMTYENDMAINN